MTHPLIYLQLRQRVNALRVRGSLVQLCSGKQGPAGGKETVLLPDQLVPGETPRCDSKRQKLDKKQTCRNEDCDFKE